MTPPRTKRVEPGERYGRGVVIAEVTLTRRTRPWRGVLLRCDCGTLYETSIYDLLRERYPTRSCGCLYRSKKSQGMSRAHRLYSTWSGMMTRCYNPNFRQFKDYGGRGIAVCERWHNARLFIEDIERLLGPRPPGMTLERIDNNGPYAPDNVCWASRKQQARNSSRFRDGTRSGPLYQLWWRLMHRRPDDMCPAWHDWAAFRDEVLTLLGDRPADMRFSRIDNARLYGPGNVAWITGAEQVRQAQVARWGSSRPIPKHGLFGHPLYGTWRKITRNHPGRMHEPWQDIRVFIAAVEAALGPKPDGRAFRLIDPNGRYEPGNVCWGPRGRPSRK